MLRALALCTLALAIGCSPSAQVPPAPTPSAPTVVAPPPPPPPAERPQNVILFIADGFGPASATLGRGVKGAPLSFDPYLVGSVETSATDSRVTDSAASATAYACGIKTYNGAIAMTPERVPCRTLLEAAEARGMATGLVATSRITHATPASFVAHVPQRAQEAEIASQMAASGVDLLMGGGRPFFNDREDGRDLTAELAAAGYTVVVDRAGFEQIEESTPVVGLFADGHLAYEIDRDESEQLSLPEMTRAAIQLLSTSPAGREHGFFLMVEGSRIDHAAHGNDLIGHAHDILAYDAAVAEGLSFARRDGSTLVVSTADHETGGMTLGRDGLYAWDPAPIRAATASFEGMIGAIEAGADAVETIRAGVGMDALPDGSEEAIRAAFAVTDRAALSSILDELTSAPAGIGWTTGGHTAVDVGLYAFGPGSERFARAMPNDAVGRALFEAMGLSR